ncbi:aminotransferase class I/II-fold pyridoxal phosphate-dependent enzyme [Aliivibrio fischeri]|uniref:DegT/DnrJ/EryC1/StrS family aminotransferase n=1 Tax=Aliivibrio fischeri TaxID=668 RepID=UPI0012D882DD|nr:DegT/DnrJ/EryC1/StrS family aminotransferase [Aliivibrio fischeri]MUK38110.1 aminotransferase class I/II-fold pyridoxal phosphate-dependent enzyme [Aliivibrio fischeri]MUL04037.1 aminotransferase class I/II-fold pyridoxal phosphate-dependent enzyme [Aliivibrio fischeri]
MKKEIPFNDLYAHYQSMKQEINGAIQDVLEKTSFVRGPHVEEFEVNYAELMQSEHCVSCANGTDSLYIAMKALGVQEGQEVLAPAHSWISTTETITQAGAKVVFCDTEADVFTIDPAEIRAKITDKTVGIIPVHLYGQAANMTEIMEIAKEHSLWVLEDCAQAHLATHKGQQVGTFGDVASFSFYPGKNLGAMGDAGAATTNIKKLADQMAKFARHGGLVKGIHEIEGINSRLDGLQAAILNVKLKYLAGWTQERQRIAARYTELLSGIDGLECPTIAEGNEHVWHLYVVRTDRRDELAAYLKEQNVQTSINYPIALPFLQAYERLGHKHEDFPNAYRNQSQILSLPIYPEMPDEFVVRVCDEICNFYATTKTK